MEHFKMSMTHADLQLLYGYIYALANDDVYQTIPRNFQYLPMYRQLVNLHKDELQELFSKKLASNKKRYSIRISYLQALALLLIFPADLDNTDPAAVVINEIRAQLHRLSLMPVMRVSLPLGLPEGFTFTIPHKP